MSILAQAKKRLQAESPHLADRVAAFTAGYLGEPLSADQDADPELHSDWEHGVRKHDKELAEEESYRVHH